MSEPAMPGRDIIVVGASAGGVEALMRLVSDLPADLPASLFVVLHLPATARSALPTLLQRRSKLRADPARDGDRVEPGRIYVAPPDQHLMLRNGTVHLTHGPKENGHRPAVDPLFRTAARTYGPRVIGVVLSGSLDDGTAGLAAVKMQGGMAVVQDPDDALFPGMPASAAANVAIDHAVPIGEMGALLARLTADGVKPRGGVAMPDHEMDIELQIDEADVVSMARDHEPGQPSVFTCPECHGTLWELDNGNLAHFRCRVGHAYSLDSLSAAQNEALESAIWAAMRSLEEKEAMARRISDRAARQGQQDQAARFAGQASDIATHARTLRSVLHSGLATLDATE